MEVTNELLMVIFTAVLAFATVGLVISTWILAIHTKSLADIEKQRDRIEPLIKLFEEPPPKPEYRKWRINVINPTKKPIRRCRVLSNGKQLPWAKGESYSEIIIPSGGAGNVLIPNTIQVEGAHIQITDGNDILLDEKYEDILK